MATTYIRGRENEGGGQEDFNKDAVEDGILVIVVFDHHERERALEGSEPGQEVSNESTIEQQTEGDVDVATALATDDEDDEDEEVEEIVETDDVGDDISVDFSEADLTLVDDGSFAQRHIQPLFEVQSFEIESSEKKLLDEEPLLLLPGKAEPDEVVEELQLALNSKLDTPLDRVLVSLSLCASLAVMDWAPQLLHPGNPVHRGRWAAVLLLLVLIPAVH